MRKLWQWLLAKFGVGARKDYSAALISDVPDVVPANVLHLVGEAGDYWLAVMRCPCGCGANIQLPMSSNAHPRWAFSGTMSKPTLTPSVWRKIGCRSHFILHDGLVVWCK